MLRRIALSLGSVLLLFAAFAFVNNSAYFAPPTAGKPVLLAHRGLAQTFDRTGLTRDACTATRIHAPEHPYLENTLPAMEAAFRAGADIVEFDVHPTTDGQFAVFHDWTLDCRTDGKGVTRDHTLAALKRLDVGYGYTADGGQTFPFRGKGLGLMPSLDDVLQAFPQRRFLINVKSNDPEEGAKLAARLGQLRPEALALLMAYGGDKPMDVLRARLPALPVMSRVQLKACALRYLTLGWSGYVPPGCRHSLVLLPIDVAPFAWGWPSRLVERLRPFGTEVFVAGPYDGGEGTSGIDTVEDFRLLPPGYAGGIWTNRIDRIAPLARAVSR